MKNKLWVGIDVSKDWVDTAGVNSQGNLGDQILQYDNSYMGYSLMVKQAEQLYKVKAKQIMFCFENTGRYSKLLVEFFTEYGYKFTEQPGLEIKLSSGMQRGTTDQEAAKQIALYAYRRRQELTTDKQQDKDLQPLADLLAYRKRIGKAIHGIGVSAKQLKQFSLSQTDQHIELRSQDLLTYLDKELKEVEKCIGMVIQNNEALKTNYDLACSVKGIGPWITAYMLVYTKNFTRFNGDWRKFACYIGTAPFEKSSGKHKGKARTSKMGCTIMKAILSMGAKAAIQYDQQIRSFTDRKYREGKEYGQVVNAVKNKLISRVFAVVNRQTPFVDLMA